MILVDTSVWIDHLRAGDRLVAQRLQDGEVLAHPVVIGELSLGTLRHRAVVLAALLALPRAAVATDAEVLHLIEMQKLAGRGIGYVDAHLLASTRLTSGATLWTRDKRLLAAAQQLRVATSR